MNRTKQISIFAFLLVFFAACRAPQPPQMAVPEFSTTVSSLTQNSVVLTCKIAFKQEDYESLEYGVYYSDVKSDVEAHNKVKRVMGSSLSNNKFNVTLNNLSSSKTYYYRVWVCVDKKQYYFGQVKSFSTKVSAEAGHDYVDLGLSVLWATKNVGATSAREAGDYFAWGEIVTKDYFNLDNYDVDNNSNILPYSKDAARMQWGGKWRTPTPYEWEELFASCEINYFAGMADQLPYYEFKGPNGKSITIPLAGYRRSGDATSYSGDYALLWSNECPDLSDLKAYHAMITSSGNIGLALNSCSFGFNVRPVFRNTTHYTVTYDANGGDASQIAYLTSSEDSYVIENNTFTKENCTFVEWNTSADGSGESYSPGWQTVLTEDITLYAQWKRDMSGTDNGNAYIDLGLSVMWATCNVGASVPEQYGILSFAWGETAPKNVYDWSTYLYGSGSYELTKYCNNSSYGYNGFTDNLMQLEAQDDAATYHMGENWRTPTREELSELIDQCDWYWTSKNGVNGYEVVSRVNGNSIFMPAAGYHYGSNYNSEGSNGAYWTSSLYESNPADAYCLSFTNTGVNNVRDNYYRYYGYPVRAVYTAAAPDDNVVGEYTASGWIYGTGDATWQVNVTQDVNDKNAYYFYNLPAFDLTLNASNIYLIGYKESENTYRVPNKQYIGATSQYYVFVETVDYSQGQENYAMANTDLLLTYEKGELRCSHSLSISAYYDAHATDLAGPFDIVIVSEVRKNTYPGNNPATYTLTFDANGGNGYMSPQTFVEGKSQCINANTFTREGYSFAYWLDDYGNTYNDGQEISLHQDLVLKAQWREQSSISASGSHNGFQYVDLNLPSGIMWATCNVGADNVSAPGNYFAWAEIAPKQTYTWDNYIYGNSDNMIKYNYSDGLTVLDMVDDAARVNMGGLWRMPTMEELYELIAYCTWSWTSRDGIFGYDVIDSDGDVLFLPAAGYYDASTLNIYNSHGLYWTSSLATSNNRTTAVHLNYGLGEPVSVVNGDRFYGRSVRAVFTPDNGSGGTPGANYATVSFDANGAEGTMTSIQVEIGVPTRLPKLGFNMPEHDFVCWALTNSGGEITYEDEAYITVTGDVTLYAIWNWYYINTGVENNHRYVDLGLPSGTKWAMYNLGSQGEYPSCADYGQYYAWGETTQKDSYSWYNYQHGTQNALFKYTTSADYDADGYYDGRNRLNASDDAAYVNWGGKWRMPTEAEMTELREQCTWIKTTLDGKSGFRVKGPNGRSIFMPLAGNIFEGGNNQEGNSALYWTSTLASSPNYGAICCEMGSNARIAYNSRYVGCSVRPVLSDETPTNYHSVQFNPNGGSGRMEPLVVEQGFSSSLPVCTFTHANSSVTFKEWNTLAEGGGMSYTEASSIEPYQDMTLYAQWATPEVTVSVTGKYNGYDFVDLGLPSGTMWATSNLGSTTPSGFGNYYMWGDTQPIDTYWGSYTAGLTDYPYYQNGRFTKYLMHQSEEGGNIDKKYKLDSGDDAAHMTMRGNWRMPSLEEIDELYSNCTREYTRMGGVNGVKFIGPNNNIIFFPCTGCYINGSNNYTSTTGDYWTSTANFDSGNDEAWYMTVRYQETGESSILSNSRVHGRPIRAVYSNQTVRDEFTVTYFANGGRDDYNGDIFWVDYVGNDTIALMDINPNDASPRFYRDGYAFAGWNTAPDGSGTFYPGGYELYGEGNMTFYAQWIPVSGKLSTYYYVDLGLPSGLKWAAYNVGTDSPYEYGDYFAWGETQPKANYTWKTYKYSEGSENTLTKYCSNSSYGYNGFADGKTALESTDDAAQVNWTGRSAWRMPTPNEWLEIKNYCTWTWSAQNGVLGYKVTSNINGNSIFLPAAGYCYENGLWEAGVDGFYWSNSCAKSDAGSAKGLYFSEGGVIMTGYDDIRYGGHTIRPVIE